MKQFTLIILFFTLFASCDKDEERINDVRNVVESGRWKIDLLILKGVDTTAHFEDDFIQFESNSTISATDAVNTEYGIWTVELNENNTDSLIFRINYRNTPKYHEFNHDWTVVEFNDSTVWLSCIRKDTNLMDQLTFRKFK